MSDAKDLLKSKSNFGDWCSVHIGIAVSTGYNLVKVYQTYKDEPQAASLGISVLKALTYATDPKEALREALATKEEKGKVELEDAKKIAKKAKEVIESGEVEDYVPADKEAQRASVGALEGSIAPTLADNPQRGSLSRPQQVARAKRLLNTLLDLLAIETANAEITDRDLLDAVAEMHISHDLNEVEGIKQLREFCSIITKPLFREEAE
jgi:hypothetical protein